MTERDYTTQDLNVDAQRERAHSRRLQSDLDAVRVLFIAEQKAHHITKRAQVQVPHEDPAHIGRVVQAIRILCDFDTTEKKDLWAGYALAVWDIDLEGLY